MASRSAWLLGSVLIGVSPFVLTSGCKVTINKETNSVSIGISPFVLAGTSRGESGPPSLAIAPFDAEAARAHQEAWAEHLGVEVQIENSIGMKLRLIPPGEFMMGSSESEEGRRDDEGPQHRVQITRPFYLGKSPVTLGEFRAFVNATGYETDAEREGWGLEVSVIQRIASGEIGPEELRKRAEANADLNVSSASEENTEFVRAFVSRGASWRSPGMKQLEDHPVLNVSWDDAVAYCKWLSEVEGREYRLPTEAEWEYSCRGGTTTRYHFGDDAGVLGEYAWYLENSEFRPHPVGQKRPNAWGLYDLHGNVLEWCSDWHSADYYANSPLEDPTGPESGSIRVCRGGSWFSTARFCHSAHRGSGGPRSRGHYLGFRVAFSPLESSSSSAHQSRLPPARVTDKRAGFAGDRPCVRCSWL
jgi:formylglycine-generating enzyme required for sulfatase activity